jgi:hypothetical protein
MKHRMEQFTPSTQRTLPVCDCKVTTTPTSTAEVVGRRTKRSGCRHASLPSVLQLLLLLSFHHSRFQTTAYLNSRHIRVAPFTTIRHANERRFIIHSTRCSISSSDLNEETISNPAIANTDMNMNDASVTTTTSGTATSRSPTTTTIIDVELEQQINQGLERARQVLQKSKAKLAARLDLVPQEEEVEGRVAVPFFAVMARTPTSVISTTVRTTAPEEGERSNVKVKSRNHDTGLIMADGERMAEISEIEAWEYRSIYEMSDVVDDDDDDADESLASSQARRRRRSAALKVQSNSPQQQTDVMASIYNLRKVLQTEDYRKIFDPRNRFIGEDN